MATISFRKTIQKLWTGQLSLASGTLKLALLRPQSSYAPNAKTDEFVDSGGGTGPIADEITIGQVANYARVTLSGVTVNETSDTITITSNAASFGTLVAGATLGRGLLFLDLGGADAANPILALFDLPALATGNKSITIAQPATAWFRSVWRSSALPRDLLFSDFTYLGNFGVNGTGTGKNFTNCGRGLAIDGSNFWMTSNSNQTPIQCQFAIPETLSTEVATDTYRSSYAGPKAAYTGTQLRWDLLSGGAHAREPGGHFGPTGNLATDFAKFHGLKIFEGEKFVTFAEYYSVDDENWTGITRQGAPGSSGWDNSYARTGQRSHQVPGYICIIPQWFASLYTGGKRLACGYITVQGDSMTSKGPPLIAFDHTTVGDYTAAQYQNAFLPTQDLIFYDHVTNDVLNRTHPSLLGVCVRGMKSQWHNWYPSDEFHGGTWVDGTLQSGQKVSGLVVAGVQGIGNDWDVPNATTMTPYYGTGGPWWEGGRGHHNTDGYENVMYSFGVSDMIRVYNGEIECWQVVPNDALIGPSQTKFWIPSFHSGVANPDDNPGEYYWVYAGYSRGEAFGCDWDPITRRLYVGQLLAYGGDGTGAPLIHVWELN